MIYDLDLWPNVRQHGWKYARRTQPVRIVIEHATRSGIPGRTAAQDFTSTVNWFSSPYNGVDQNGDGDPDWGGMASVIVGGGKIARVLPDDYLPTYSAGHMDIEGLSIEIAQATIDTPFEERDLDLAARQTAEWCLVYNIPPVVLAFVSGDNREAPGIARHDRSANGRSYGKSDPGPLFDDRDFERRVKRFMQPAPAPAPQPTPEEDAEMRALQHLFAAGLFAYAASRQEHGLNLPQHEKDQMAWLLGGTSPRQPLQWGSDEAIKLCRYAAARSMLAARPEGAQLDQGAREKLRSLVL